MLGRGNSIPKGYESSFNDAKPNQMDEVLFCRKQYIVKY